MKEVAKRLLTEIRANLERGPKTLRSKTLLRSREDTEQRDWRGGAKVMS